MKKLMSVVLALCMTLALCATAWAEGPVNAKAFPEGGDDKVVYWSVGEKNGFSDSLADALKAAYMANDGTKSIEIICKAGADVGAMTHGHVVDDLTIYGNGAYVSGGEYDLEVDTYKFSRTTGAHVDVTASELDKDITITVYDLNGIAVWGERKTAHTVTVSFYNCKNMNRAYLSGTAGSNVLLFDGCSFDASNGSNKNTSIYSNAAGSVTVKNTDFNGIAVPVNLNNKSAGNQTVTVENCDFNNCATEATVATETSTKEYAAPIRVLVQAGANTTLNVKNCSFTGDSANGDILVGDGRATGSAVNANVTMTVTNTEADVQVQESGYYTNNGTNDDNKVTSGTVAADQTLTLTTENNAPKMEVADTPVVPEPVPEPEAPTHHHTRRQPTTTTTTDTTKTDTTTTTTDAVTSAKTFDGGIALYGVMAVLSVTGSAVVIGKKKF